MFHPLTHFCSCIASELKNHQLRLIFQSSRGETWRNVHRLDPCPLRDPDDVAVALAFRGGEQRILRGQQPRCRAAGHAARSERPTGAVFWGGQEPEPSKE